MLRYSNLLAPFYSDSEGALHKMNHVAFHRHQSILQGTDPFLLHLRYNTNNLQLKTEIRRCQKCARKQTVHLWRIMVIREAVELELESVAIRRIFVYDVRSTYVTEAEVYPWIKD
jgi:hypothetical protein